MELTSSLPPDHPAFAVEARLTALETALLAQDPQMPTHLKAIHAQLIQFPELVHLLEPADWGKVMQAQQQYTKVKLVEEGAAKKAAAKKKITVDDLF